MPSRRQAEGRARENGASPIGRILALIALALVALGVVLLLLDDSGDYTVTAEFQNASQLVSGNQVVVGGAPVGSVEEIELGARGLALVTFSVSEDYAPLRRGTTATVRSPSLASIAGREVDLILPAESDAGPEIPDGGRLGLTETVSAVDLDQLFNTLSSRTRRDFKRVVGGLATAYDGVGREANRGLRYLSPFLSTSRRVLAQLASDQTVFEQLVVDGSQLSDALAARASDISALVGNLDRMMNAIARRKRALARSISLLPGFLRHANTTFVNLRAALDDLDPLVSAAKPVARRLRPFLTELRRASADAVPTVRDLDAILRRPGAGNDLVELVGRQPELAEAAIGSGSPECGADPTKVGQIARAADGDFTQGAFGETVCALRNSQPQLSMLRAYTPELVGWFDDFAHPAFIDALGGVGRIEATFNSFGLSGAGLNSPEQALGLLDTGNYQRCPGANERPVSDIDPSDTSVPFTDGGALTDGRPGECDPSQLPLGP